MLKIKDNVDLKELEKYGYRYIKNPLGDETLENYYTMLYPEENRIIYPSPYIEFEERGFDEIYDLIKADLVEKVDD